MISSTLLWNIVLPLAASGLSVVASAAIAIVTGTIKRKFGLDIEANHRSALHSAIVTGINKALTTVESNVRFDIKVGNPLTRIALEYALKSVPDAVGYFKLDTAEGRAQLENMIISKFQQVTGQTSPVVSPTT